MIYSWSERAAEKQRQAESGELQPARPDLRIVETRVYRGPNYWSYEKAVHLLVDLGSLEDRPSNTLPGLVDELLRLLPGLEEHSCSTGRRGGFVERLREGTWLGHVAEHVALQLQRVQREGLVLAGNRFFQPNHLHLLAYHA